MGLADQLFAFSGTGLAAGLGQGLAQGVQNYNQGQEQQQQMALRKQEAERQMQLFAMQKQQHDFDQNAKVYALQQHDAQDAITRGDWGGVASLQHGINTSRQGMGLAALPEAQGLVTPAQPARTLPQYGPMWSGEALPNKGLAATPESTSYDDQAKQSMMTLAGYAPPKPTYHAYGHGQSVYKETPGGMELVGTTPEKPGDGYTLAPGTVRVDGQGHIIARGAPKTTAAPRGQFVTYTDDSGNPQIGFGDPTTGAIRPTGMAGRQASGGKPNKDWEGFRILQSSKLEPVINQAATANGLDPALLKGLLWQESGFNPNARSPVGALGIAQFMPDTAKDVGVDPMNPQAAINGAARHLAGLIRANKGDVRKALAAYNAGQGAVDKYGGIPPFAETQTYVPSVLGHMAKFANAPGGPKPMTKKQIIDEVDATLRAEKPGRDAMPDEVSAFQAKRQAMLNKRLRETAAGGAPAQAPAAQKPQTADDAEFSKLLERVLP